MGPQEILHIDVTACFVGDDIPLGAITWGIDIPPETTISAQTA